MKDTIAMAFITFLVITCAFLLNKKECEIKANIQNMEYQYGILKGCIVKKNNKWIDYKILRETN